MDGFKNKFLVSHIQNFKLFFKYKNLLIVLMQHTIVQSKGSACITVVKDMKLVSCNIRGQEQYYTVVMTYRDESRTGLKVNPLTVLFIILN